MLKKQMEEQKLIALQRQEEESKRLGGRMLNMLGKMQRDETPRDMTCSGIELGTTKVKILAKNVSLNSSLMCLSMTRKLIDDEMGVDLARMLMINTSVRKIEFEGNKLGPQAPITHHCGPP